MLAIQDGNIADEVYITRVATATNEAVLVNVARYGTASHVENLVKKYRWTQARAAANAAHEQQPRMNNT